MNEKRREFWNSNLASFLIASTVGTALFLAIVVTIGTGAREATQKELVDTVKAETLELIKKHRGEICR